MRSFFVSAALGAALSVISVHAQVRTFSVSPAARTCLQTCSGEVTATDTPPCGKGGIQCQCTPPSFMDGYFICLNNECADAAKEAFQVLTAACPPCAGGCSISSAASQLLVSGSSGSVILSLTGGAGSFTPTAGAASAPGATTASGTGATPGGAATAAGGTASSGTSAAGQSGASASSSPASSDAVGGTSDASAAASPSDSGDASDAAASPSTTAVQDKSSASMTSSHVGLWALIALALGLVV
ncbi:hypothetical protein EXIGLDRAFT_704503 [Exidia glandulosa HHB12029]|uniref:CFEM domain-containing protein n=1 Tax=Exidia glandulosa HHB12029 TaxID=1314781 RepID=A0A165KWB7_EXIGL|nr:hypothetical protein EXIGLDRAFT_704503 [Exidia glandulosa HHB12029]